MGVRECAAVWWSAGKGAVRGRQQQWGLHLCRRKVRWVLRELDAFAAFVWDLCGAAIRSRLLVACGRIRLRVRERRFSIGEAIRRVHVLSSSSGLGSGIHCGGDRLWRARFAEEFLDFAHVEIIILFAPFVPTVGVSGDRELA